MDRKIRIIIGFGLAGLLFVGVIWPNLPFNAASATSAAQQQFKTHWIAKFRQCHTLQQVQAASTQGQTGYLNTRTFKDGSWVAIAWHSIHDSGGEWDGSVLLDSKSELFWSNYHFCGYEGFQAELLSVPAQSINQFYGAAKFQTSPIK